MKNFKVKLISPISITTHWNFVGTKNRIMPPYGLGILTSFLRNKGYDVVLDDMLVKSEKLRPFYTQDINSPALLRKINEYLYGVSYDKKIGQFIEQMAQAVSCWDYDLVGITISGAAYFFTALLLTKKLKSISKAKIVLGGPFVTLYGKEFFTQLYHGDYMVTGDGQVPLLSLIEHLEGQRSIEDVPNLIYRQNGRVKENSARPFPIEDLCVPDFSDLPLDFYYLKRSEVKFVLYYQISRGCTHRCSFCQSSGFNALEFKSHNKVIRELKVMKESYKNNFFLFSDETINFSYDYLDKLCDMFLEEKLGIFWATQARPDNLDRKILRKMKASGCVNLGFGIESGSNRILKMMNKGFSIEQASEVLKNSYYEGIGNSINLLAGYPHEQEEDINKTVDFIKENAEYISVVQSIAPCWVARGSPLYDHPEKFGIKNLRSSEARFSNFGFDEISGLTWKEKIKQQEYSLRKLKRAAFKYVLSKTYRISFIPFWLYSFIYYRFYGLRSFRLFEWLRLRLSKRKN